MTQWSDGQWRDGPQGGNPEADHKARVFTPADVLLVAGFLALLFVAFDDFSAGAAPVAEPVAPDTPRLEQVCSEQELRHMRAGVDACFDEVKPGARDSGAEPATVSFASS